MKNKKFQTFLPYLSLAGAITYLIIQIVLGSAPIDDGDGLQHFAIAKASFQDPANLLDHWGKPFFTLLSSPFAQFGFKAFTLFNVLVFLITQLLAFQLFKAQKTSISWMVFVPWLFVIIPDYTYCIIGGLTEPLFGLLLTLMLWSALNKKWFVFAMVASFAPFARSEGMLVVASAICLLLWLKEWKFIPFVFVGFLVYMLFGWIVLNDAIWYFHNDPYPAVSPYGHGKWSDYLLNYKTYFGIINLLLLPFMVFGLLVWRQHDKRFRTPIIVLFTVLFFGIIAVHSYYWTFGLKGSAGLTRVAIQGLPAFLILAYIGIGAVLKELHVLVHAFVTMVMVLIVVEETSELSLPNKANPFQQTCSDVSNYLSRQNINGKVYYFHPLIMHYLGYGTKDEHPTYKQKFQILGHIKDDLLRPGDIIVRDSKFGAVEFGMPLSEIKNYPQLVPIQHFFSAESFLEINGEQKGVTIYEVIPPVLQKDLPQSSWLVHSTTIRNKSYHLKKGVEFIDIDPTFTLPRLKGSQHVLKLTLDYKGKQSLFLYFDNGNGMVLFQELKPGQNEISLTFSQLNTQGKLFFHNPSKERVSFKVLSSNWSSLQDIGYQKLY